MKSALRDLLKKPGFNLLVILALALGLGANTAVFSVVNGVLLKPLPFTEAENLLIVRETKIPQFPEFSVSPGNFFSWQKQSSAFESIGAWRLARFNLVGDFEPEVLLGANVMSSVFSTLRVSPILGRGFTADDDQEGKSNVVILSHRLWQRRFASDPGVLGRSINLNARSYTVIGVMASGQEFPNRNVELWSPIGFNAQSINNHGSHYLNVIARLKSGRNLEQARAELETIARRLESEFPGSNAGWGVKIMSLMDNVVGRVRTSLLVLLGAVVFVLFIACANAANLLLVRSNARQREMAIRVAIGASRWQVIRQVLSESLLLSGLAAAIGILLAYWGIDTLLVMAPQILPRAQEVRIDTTVLVFTVLISMFTGLIFGLMPAVQSSKPNLNDTLKEHGRGTRGGRQHMRHALVVAEVAVSLILLVGAGLLIRSFMRLQQVSPGFEAQHALAVSLALPSQKYIDDDQRRNFVDRVTDEIQSLPGVQAVGVGHAVPFMDDYVVGVIVEGRPPAKPGEDISTNYYAVTPGYFTAMGIPLKRGRAFTSSDTASSMRVAVISESLAKRVFPNEDPIGKRVQLTQGPTAWREIVGIVSDVKQYGLDRETTLQAYEPFAQMPFSGMTFVVRSDADPATISRSVRARILSVDKDQPVTTIRPLDQAIADSIGAQRFSTLLLTVFAGIALLLATVGLYGVLAYLVTERTHEIGLRMALGAPRTNVFRLVVRQGLVLTLIGLAIGIAGSLVLTRLMSTMLYEISATDPVIFSAIPVVLTIVAVLACYLPARRATLVDPLIALRHE